jgi:hypothetical protein
VIAADVYKELEVIESRLAGVLDGSSTYVLGDARARLGPFLEKEKKAKTAAKKKKLDPWRLVIQPSAPLAFGDTGKGTVNHRLRVDLFCDISQPDENGRPRDRHNIAVRVRTSEKDLAFRQEWDAEHLEGAILAANLGRVMCRFHFDFAEPDQQGPRFHLQVGGKQHDGEYCWYPDTLEVPRFAHHPMSLILTCEFILQTFYPLEYQKIAEDSSWKAAIKRAQEIYIVPYVAKLGSIDCSARSLLKAIWNT